MKKEFIEKIEDAELILVGIGSEFEKEKLKCGDDARKALKKLYEILKGKNYFLLTTCTNSVLAEVGFPEERCVSPCGNMKWKQCINGCDDTLYPLTKDDRLLLENVTDVTNIPELGKCPICGKALVLNNVYAEKYNESSYLDAWKMYTKWLQGTLNKKLCVLELGVDMTFPNIIRWPFEKVAFYNNKAVFIRVNEKLYHMSEALKDKGVSVGENAIAWLEEK